MADFDIDPDAVTQSINRLRAASEDFGTAWEQRKQALQASQARFGKDHVAQVFAEKYLPLADKLTARADAMPPSFGQLCDDATCCVDDYRAADAGGTGTLNRLTNTE